MPNRDEIALQAPGAAPEVRLIAVVLTAQGVAARVVSMPSWELCAAQDAGCRAQMLPPQLPARVAVGWQRQLRPGSHQKGDSPASRRSGCLRS